MKKVLIITYYFPPSGGPGVQRVLKFVKYLPEFGWDPVVLTVQDGDFPARDESLLEEIPKHIHVHRTNIFEPYRLYRKLTGRAPGAAVDVENIPKPGEKKSLAELGAEFIRGTFFIPDARIGWFPYAVPQARQIIKDEGIDAIYSSSPPYTTAIIARELHRKTGLPWIAGFRDPWTGFLSTPDRWLFPRRIDEYLERSVAEDANLVESAWVGINTDFQKKYPHINKLKFLHLPNGYDSEDYPTLDRRPNERFTVTYTGSMYGKRNPETLLRAVDELIEEKKVDPSKVCLNFIGRFGGDVRAMFGRFPTKDVIRVVDYVPHSESIRELLAADALLLVVDESKDSDEIVPGKVFEYIGAQRPIIALAPEGAVAGVVRETNSGIVVHNQDIPGIKSAFLECYENFLYHKKKFSPNQQAMKKYERREVTHRLAELLDYLQSQRESRH